MNAIELLARDIHLPGLVIRDDTVGDLHHHHNLSGCRYVRSIPSDKHTKRITREREYREVAAKAFLSNFKFFCGIAMGLEVVLLLKRG